MIDKDHFYNCQSRIFNKDNETDLPTRTTNTVPGVGAKMIQVLLYLYIYLDLFRSHHFITLGYEKAE